MILLRREDPNLGLGQGMKRPVQKWWCVRTGFCMGFVFVSLIVSFFLVGSNGRDKLTWHEGGSWLICYLLLFHIGHNEVMAKKVGGFIRDIIAEQEKKELL